MPLVSEIFKVLVAGCMGMIIAYLLAKIQVESGNISPADCHLFRNIYAMIFVPMTSIMAGYALFYLKPAQQH